MGISSGADFHQQPTPQAVLPPRPHGRAPTLQTSLSLAGSASPEQVGSPPDTQEPLSNSDAGHDSATESASSRETWPGEPGKSGGGDAPPVASAPITALRIADNKEKEVVGNGVAELQAFRSRIPSAGRMTLREVAWDRVDLVAEKMKGMSDELLDETKAELQSILEGTGGQHQIQEFMYLQKLLQGRVDLTLPILLMAHHVQLEILVAIKTGIQAFLHPSVDIPQIRLAEIFLYKRCRNIACQSAVPAEECKCNICSNRNGFCNLCMCVICNKFDFEVNTCRWVGCDICSHWTHTDCAIRDGKIGTGQTIKNGVGHAEMLFRCQACQRTSELFGWVRDVFQQCAPNWDRDALLRELDYVCKIFRLSEDSKGRKLFRKCAELVERLRGGSAESMTPRILLQALQELDIDSSKNFEHQEPGRLITPQEACNRIAEVVQEAVRKMEMVAEEKLRTYKRARLAVKACDRELEEKAREAQELKVERLRKLQQAEELESIIRLKQAESEMFQLKASEAQEEAERLRSVALAKRKSEAAGQDYASMYLKRRLEEAEAEKQYIFEKIKLQENQHATSSSGGGARLGGGAPSAGEPSQAMMLSKIQDLLKNVRSVPSGKPDGQRSK
ncbi:OBERON-like protein [Zea mays]|uniref:OBERON-like protein n=1 Tax=Zea mays TaxID=4577 RepID=A0A3L6FWB7_MAIZE|nr:OBERON-like protein [Zea mays]